MSTREELVKAVEEARTAYGDARDAVEQTRSDYIAVMEDADEYTDTTEFEEVMDTLEDARDAASGVYGAARRALKDYDKENT